MIPTLNATFMHDGVYCGPHYRDAKGKSQKTISPQELS